MQAEKTQEIQLPHPSKNSKEEEETTFISWNHMQNKSNPQNRTRNLYTDLKDNGIWRNI